MIKILLKSPHFSSMSVDGEVVVVSHLLLRMCLVKNPFGLVLWSSWMAQPIPAGRFRR